MSNSMYCDDQYKQPEWVERMEQLERQVKELEAERKKLPMWKRGTPPRKGWWLTKTECRNGKILIACESWVDDEWPHEYDDNVLYMDMNELKDLPAED